MQEQEYDILEQEEPKPKPKLPGMDKAKPPLPGIGGEKKNLGMNVGEVGGTVGSSKAPLNATTYTPNTDQSNPFSIGGQYNQPKKLDADNLDLLNTKHDAAIAEQIKKYPLRKIPLTPILDNTALPKPITEIDINEALARNEQHKIDMQTAIDNTTLKVLKQKGIVAGKGSPYYEAERKKIEEKTKPTMIGGIVINGAEATYHKDKDGNIGLDRNLGFLEGIRKGFNAAVDGEDEANAFAEMNTQQKVEYANRQMEGKPTEYMEERGGVGELLGGAAPYLIKAAAAGTLATAAAISAPETGGASLVGLAPTLTVLLTAPDMIKQGAKDEIMTRYMQLKQERPNIPDEELMNIAQQGEISGGIVGAAQALAFTTTLKLPILNDSKSVLKTYLKGVASSAVHLGGIMAGTKAAQLAERKLEGYNVDTDKAVDEIATTFTENATAGAVLNGLISGAHVLPKVVKSAFKYALKDTPTSEIKTALQANVDAGRIPPEVAEQTIADIDGYKTALAKTSDGLTPETQASVAGLIQARDNVAAEMATKDPTQREVYEQKIEAYNKQIEKITKTNDPLKYEIDEVTGNPIDKVAPEVKGEPENISQPIELSTDPSTPQVKSEGGRLGIKSVRDLALKEFEKSGLKTGMGSFSETDFGTSAYFNIERPDGTWQKVRVSDHSVTNKGRMADEIHIYNESDIPKAIEQAKQKIDNYTKNEKARDELFDRDKKRTTEANEKWEEIKPNFEGQEFATMDRTYDDLEAFKKKHPTAKNIIQTPLDKGAFSYEWSFDKIKNEKGNSKPSRNYIENFESPTDLQKSEGVVDKASNVDEIYDTKKQAIEDKLNQQLEDNKDRLDDIADKDGTKTIRQKIYQEHTNDMVELEKWKMKEDLKNEKLKADKPKKDVVDDLVDFAENNLGKDNKVHPTNGGKLFELNTERLSNAVKGLRDKIANGTLRQVTKAIQTVREVLNVSFDINNRELGKKTEQKIDDIGIQDAKKRTDDELIAHIDELESVKRNNDSYASYKDTRGDTQYMMGNDNFDPYLTEAVNRGLVEIKDGKLSRIKDKASNVGGDVELKEGFTEGKDLNKIYAGLKSKYGDKKGAAIYEAANRLVNPNTNTIVEIRGNGVVVKEGGKYILKPFGNTDANMKKWTLYKGIDVTDQFTKQSLSKQESEVKTETVNEETETKIPNPSKKEVIAEPVVSEPALEGEGGKKEGITHAAVEELRKIIELPEYEGKPVDTHESLIAEAQQVIKNNPNAANEVLDKMDNGGKITNKDNAIAAIYKATIDAEMAKNPTPELLKRATRLAKALDVSGTELGKALESRKLVGTEDNLTNFLLDKQAAQGTALTETQIKSEAAKYEELKAAHDALEKQLEVEREQHAKDIAEMGVNKAKAKAKKAAKKSDAEYKAERKEIVDAARKALKDIRDNPQSSAAPLFRELVAIAPHVKKFMESVANNTADKFDNILTDIHAEFKDVLDGLTKRNVLDILVGEYDTAPKQQTRNEKKNTIRLLQREAELLKQLERERKGEEKAKSESKKTQSNRRIDELKKKIKEVRSQNKNKEVDTEAPEDMSAGEIEYNAKLQKKLTEKAQKLLQDIRDKKYLEEDSAKPVFKKSRKTQLLEDKVIDLENKIRHERSKDEYNKRGKLRKGFDKVMEVLGLRRLVQSALDMSVPFRQGATLLSPRKIDVWAKGFQANLQSIFSPKKFDRINHEIRNDPMYHDMVKDNVVFNDLSSADPNLHNEDFRKSFIYKIPIISEPLKASNRSADAFLNVARFEMYKKLRRNLEKRGLTRESDPKAFKFIGNWTMAMTGRGTMHSALEKPAMNAVLGNTFYGARLMASRFNLLNPVTYFDPRIPKEAKYEAMKDMVAFTTTMMTVATALAYTTGAKISLNPDDSDFLQLRYGKKVYDISGGLANYVRTGLRIAKAAYTKASGTKYEGQKATDNAGKSVLNFFRNKLSPNTAYATDAFFGGRYGNEFDKSDIYRIYPMYTEDFLKAIKEEGGVMATATVLLPNILGIGYGGYASKGQIDANLEDLLQRNMRSDEMNSEKIHNYKDKGRVITFDEFNKFADKRDEKIKKDLETLFNKGINGKAYKDLTQEEVIDETTFIKANATRETKKELFGEKDNKSSSEKKEDKKLLEERKRNYKGD